MSTISRLFLFFLCLFFFTPHGVHAQESIQDFHADIQVDEDSKIHVTETIKYDFGVAERHGIYRNIPVKYKTRGGNYTLRMENISVTDTNGKNYQFTTSKSGRDIVIKVGNPKVFVTGEVTYVFSYAVTRAINFFDAQDELYWNVTGDEWNVPIHTASATVKYPETHESPHVDCFTGPYGSTQRCNAINASYTQTTFSQGSLSPSEGLTIVIGLPQGTVHPLPLQTKILYLLSDNSILLLPIAAFIFFYFFWRAKGRDPKGHGTIIARYSPPDNLTPTEIGTIIDERAENKDISAALIDFAVRGYIKIKKLKKELFSSQDYTLERLREGDTLKNDFEKDLFAALFKEKYRKGSPSVIVLKKMFNLQVGEKKIQEQNEKNKNPVVKLSDLKNSFYKDFQKIQKSVYENTVQKGYFPESPQKVRTKYFITFAFWMGAIFSLFLFLRQGVTSYEVAAFIISELIGIAFSFIMPIRTKKGVAAREHILGLKKYLEVAEKDRINFHNAPQRNPKHFEALLPHAMALGVEREWAQQFKDIYKTQPDWYSDPSGNAFNAIFFASSLSHFSTASETSMSSTPSSASGGGSGFSGGGGGGGFGGGGGGSW